MCLHGLLVLVNGMAVPGFLLAGKIVARLSRLSRALVVAADDVGWVRAHNLVLILHDALVAVVREE